LVVATTRPPLNKVSASSISRASRLPRADESDSPTTWMSLARFRGVRPSTSFRTKQARTRVTSHLPTMLATSCTRGQNKCNTSSTSFPQNFQDFLGAARRHTSEALSRKSFNRDPTGSVGSSQRRRFSGPRSPLGRG
jgi:hypothetical protein